MEIRIKREKPKKLLKAFPNNCIVCKSDTIAQYCDIHYHPKVKTTQDLKNFVMPVPLCPEHHEKYMQGKKMAKLAMYLFISSLFTALAMIIPAATIGSNPYSIIFGVITVSVTMVAIGLLGPANTKLKENGREMVHIKLITGSEIILLMKDEEYVELMKKKGKI